MFIKRFFLMFLPTLFLLLFTDSQACTRVLHVFKDGLTMTGRSMDWYLRYPTTIWKFPRGLERSGLTKENPLHWISKYGSVVIVQTAAGQSAAVDGINEKGLVANMLYLSETEYGKRDPSKKGITTSVFVQFLLDNFATVKEAVDFLNKGKVQLMPVPIPNSEHLPTMHISVSDATGDSAIIEVLKGKFVIHHSPKYQVMTNSPVFEKQLALTAYWEEIGGHNFLPGTRKSPDRFVRASFYNKHLPEPKDYREAVASLMSIMRNVSSPFGRPDPEKPNISTTLWRTIADQTNLRYFYESTISPNLVWVDMKKLDFSKGAKVEMVNVEKHPEYMGEINKYFKSAKPIEYAQEP
ncbi:linear amide C-N hydrolase [Persephonella sp.]|uniref:linear amide C-N hydrolase n=1 Tax=Persephonella sp. TaxID=2060922 RepID=UPI00260B5E42|nr:linear amide C-N hydrolase [Persephonella sp.]